MSEKKIKDYLHLYIGVEVIAPSPDPEFYSGNAYLTGICGEHGAQLQFIDNDGNVDESPSYEEHSKVKPILRRLSSMTVEELNEWLEQIFAPEFANHVIKKIASSVFGFHQVISQYGSTDSIPKLLKQGFDLFGLIDAGLACVEVNQEQS